MNNGIACCFSVDILYYFSRVFFPPLLLLLLQFCCCLNRFVVVNGGVWVSFVGCVVLWWYSIRLISIISVSVWMSLSIREWIANGFRILKMLLLGKLIFFFVRAGEARLSSFRFHPVGFSLFLFSFFTLLRFVACSTQCAKAIHFQLLLSCM